MISGIKKLFKDPRCILRKILVTFDFSWMPDRPYLKILYYAHIGKKLNLENPTAFSEKLQWLKLYDRNPLYTAMVDKYEVKKIVAETIGQEYVVPTLGVWDCAEDIDFDALPDRFVLKTTHDSGTAMICKDKSRLDVSAVKQELSQSLQRKYFYWGREWPYKNVKPKIICEKLMVDEIENQSDKIQKEKKENALTDYKFFCFEGVPKFMYVSKDKSDTPETDFYDMNGKRIAMRMKDPNSKEGMPLPYNFKKMQELAKTLSAPYHHARIDFYECNHKIYFGEITFYHCSGLAKIQPDEFDTEFGSWITLPKSEEMKD